MKLYIFCFLYFHCLKNIILASNSFEFVVETIVQVLENNRFSHLKTKCDLLTIGKSVFYVPKTAVRIVGDPKLRLASLENSKCLIIISFLNKKNQLTIDEFELMLKKTRDSSIIFLGTQDFHDKFIPKRYIGKHIYYLQHNLNFSIIKFYSICPKEEKFSIEPQFSINLENSWHQKKGFLVDPFQLGKLCSHPLANRVVNISYNLADPDIRRYQGKIQGPESSFLKIVAKKFQFVPNFIHSPFKKFQPSAYKKVLTNESLMGIGLKAIRLRNIRITHFTTHWDTKEFGFASRHPRRISSIDNIKRIFSGIVWLAILLTLSTFSFCFGSVYIFYLKVLKKEDLIRSKLIPWVEFIIHTFAKFVEPDPIKWFPKWSTGKLLVVLWRLFTLMIVLFFTSNLRTILIATIYEKPINTLSDIINSQRNVYIPIELANLDHKRMKLSKDLLEISKRADSIKGGRFKYSLYNGKVGFPKYIRDDIKENGAMVPVHSSVMLYEIFKKDSFGYTYGQITSESFNNFFTAIVIPQFSPWQNDLDRVVGQMRDMGFYKKLLLDPLPLNASKLWKPTQDNSPRPLNVKHIAILYLFLGTGLFLAFIVLLFENNKKICKKSKVNRSSAYAVGKNVRRPSTPGMLSRYYKHKRSQAFRRFSYNRRLSEAKRVLESQKSQSRRHSRDRRYSNSRRLSDSQSISEARRLSESRRLSEARRLSESRKLSEKLSKSEGLTNLNKIPTIGKRRVSLTDTGIVINTRISKNKRRSSDAKLSDAVQLTELKHFNRKHSDPRGAIQ